MSISTLACSPLAEKGNVSTRAAVAAPPAPTSSATANDDVEARWGGRGHAMVNREASRDLPADMPDFFRTAGDALETLGGQPDRWKMRGLPNLDVMNRPDHYVNYELLGSRPIPSERYSYVAMIANEHLQLGDSPPYSVGLLPYAIAEYTEKLTAELALYRHEVSVAGEESTVARQYAQNAIYTAGILGHFAADASQPLHASAHHDGWNPDVEPNPDGFTTERGLHFRFESLFVNTAVRPRDVAARLQPAQVLAGTPLEIADRFCRQTNQQVRPLYTLERDGKLDISKPSEEGRAFAVECVANGAQFLRNLWYTAWQRSEALATDIPDTDHEKPSLQAS